jgi:hypothetical protein
MTAKLRINNNIVKSDCYSNAHYSLLFTKLTEESISSLKKDKRIVSLHKEIFHLDFLDPEC